MSNSVDHPYQYHEKNPINQIECNRVHKSEHHVARVLIQKQVFVVVRLKDLFEEITQAEV